MFLGLVDSFLPRKPSIVIPISSMNKEKSGLFKYFSMEAAITDESEAVQSNQSIEPHLPSKPISMRLAFSKLEVR